jgi:iron complex transport system substrate-binding protein
VPFTDSAGRAVEIPAQITRIAPSGSLAQLFLIAIAPDLLVSVAADYSNDASRYVPEVLAGLPVTGQLYGSADLNAEAVAAIGPEIIIDVGEPKKTIVEDMDDLTAKLAVPAIHVTAALRSSADAFRTLGAILGREERAEAIAAFLERVLARADGIMEQVGDRKARVLYCLGDAGLNVLAKTSFHAEVLDMLTDNVAVLGEVSSSGNGNETDLEQIMLWAPGTILFAPNSAYASVGGDPVWQQLAAIQDGSYYEVPFGPYNWMGTPPSINRYLGLLWVPKVLYPEYADYDLYEEAAEYYRLFYGHELTRDEYDALLANSLPAAAAAP